jgi:hypothetical protein
VISGGLLCDFTGVWGFVSECVMSNNCDFKVFFSQFVPKKKKLKIVFSAGVRRDWQQDVQS